MTRRCLIYAHWDVNGFVDPYVIHALREYRLAVDRIVFVSTNYQLPNPDLDAVADDVIVRDNVGFDFLSWRAGLEAVGLDAFDHVIFANSSIYGPVWPFERVLASSIVRNAGVWGMTISSQHAQHLQSYFMTMSREFLLSEPGAKLWEEVRPLRNKVDVIEAYELQWMGKVVKAGVPVTSVFDAKQFPDVPIAEQLANMVRWPMNFERLWRYRQAVRCGPSNPTHLHWKQMLESGVPFVKIDLFSSNPYGIRLSRIYKWLEKHTNYPTDLIRNHQARLLRQRAVAA